ATRRRAGWTNASVGSPVAQLTEPPFGSAHVTPAPRAEVLPSTRNTRFEASTPSTGSSNRTAAAPESVRGTRIVAVGAVSSAKDAVTARAWFIVTVHVYSKEPSHAPDHPSNCEPASGIAVS